MSSSGIVTLYVDDTSIRLLIVRGRTVKRWASVNLEPGLIKDGLITNESKVAARIRELFQSQNIKADKITVGMSGRRSFTRPIAVPRLSGALLAEAVKKEAEKVLPVPLEELYLSWQQIPTSSDRMYLFVVAIPKNTADALVRTLHEAGLEPTSLDIKPLALAQMVDEQNCIIVDVQQDEFDIVILSAGIPQPIRTLPFPANAQNWQQKLPVIIADVDRTIKFFNSGNKEDPLKPGVPMFVSGELARAPDIYETMAKELGHSVSPLNALLKCSNQLDPSQYTVNIGLALKSISPGKQASGSAINVNSLPDVYCPKPVPLSKVLVPIGMMACIGVLAYLVMMVQQTATQAAAMETQVKQAETVYKQRQNLNNTQKAELAALQGQVSKAEASGKELAGVLKSFSDGHDKVNGDLALSTSALPAEVEILSISCTATDLVLTGTAPDEIQILLYAINLRQSERFDRVTITSIEADGEVMNFTLNMVSAKN